MKEMLFEVPTNELRRAKFKRLNQIQTHNSPGCEPNWCALHLPTARQFGCGVTTESSMFDCIAKVGCLLDESGVMGYGNTEVDAIVATCKACKITVLPNDL